MVHEVEIDQGFVNDAFGDEGGAKQLNKILSNKLDGLLEAINDGLWAQALTPWPHMKLTRQQPRCQCH